MTAEEIQRTLEKLEKQIKDAYSRYSIIDKVCRPVPVNPSERFGKFTQFASRFLIERQHITDSSVFLMLDEIGTSVARDETKYIIDYLSKSSPSKNVEKVSHSDLIHEVSRLWSEGFTPNHIFMPIDYFHDVFEWNRGRPLATYERGLSATDSLQISPDLILKISYSNKYVEFEDIIITSRKANKWEYRPVDDTPNRLIVKFDWNYNDPINTILEVKTVFNFVVEYPEGNFVLKKQHT